MKYLRVILDIKLSWKPQGKEE